MSAIAGYELTEVARRRALRERPDLDRAVLASVQEVTDSHAHGVSWEDLLEQVGQRTGASPDRIAIVSTARVVTNGAGRFIWKRS